VLTKALEGDSAGRVCCLHGCEIEWCRGPKGWEMRERASTEFTLKAELVLLAMGFVHVVHQGLVEQLGIELSAHGNVVTRNWMTSEEGVFAAGDTVRGASLVVHAIHEGRLAASAVDAWLNARAS
jgi:glutamate synthase (NADPH/NADH) small chain